MRSIDYVPELEITVTAEEILADLEYPSYEGSMEAGA